MSPSKIPDEKKDKHWAAMLALSTRSGYSPGGVASIAWDLVEAHYDFITAKERKENFIPADDIDEEDGA